MIGRRVLAVAFAAVLVAGCDDDLQLAQDFITQWAADHAVGLAAGAAGVPTGDSLVDAAAGAAPTVTIILKADAAMEEGRTKRAADKMDEALGLRPHDWTYQMSRAHLALEMGDIVGYRRYASAWPADSGAASPATVATQEYSELNAARRRLVSASGVTNTFASYNQCVALYDGLMARASVDSPVGSSHDLDDWTIGRQGCDSMPH